MSSLREGAKSFIWYFLFCFVSFCSVLFCVFVSLSYCVDRWQDSMRYNLTQGGTESFSLFYFVADWFYVSPCALLGSGRTMNPESCCC